MIKLPDNFLSQARVDTRVPAILLHYKNSADEYFTAYIVMDLAMKLDEQLDSIVSYDLSLAKAYRLEGDLRTTFVLPAEQDWKPAPVPGDGILSVDQYRKQLEQMQQAHNSGGPIVG